MADNFDIPDDDEPPLEDRPYEVGYGKPPKHSRFKPGNQAAKGQRRKRKDTRLQQMADRLFKEKLAVTIDGKSKRITRAEAMLRTSIQQSMKSPKDAIRLLAWAMQNEPEEPPPWVGQKIIVEFVDKQPFDEPLPGAPAERDTQKLKHSLGEKT